MVNPTLAPLTCDDALVYEPSELYQALTAVVNGAFTPKEKAKDLHFNLLIDSLGQVTSPSQLPPFATAIESAGVTAAQRQILWARFNGLLESMQPDARSFAASLPALSVLTAPSSQASFEKYRQKSHGCETDSAPSSDSPASNRARPSWSFIGNPRARSQLLQTGKTPCVDTNCFGADRASADWQQQLADYLNLIASFDAGSSGIGRRLLSREVHRLYVSARSGDDRSTERQDPGRLCRFRRQFRPLSAKPGRMVRSNRNTLLDRSQNNPALHSRVLQAFHDSGNPVLALEVVLENTFAAANCASAPSNRRRVFHLS